MKDIIIGDLHFGIKTNSITWLESQINFVENQIITSITEENPDRVIFLGDLFDIRYSINQQVGIEVKKLIRKILSQFPDISFIFVAGNHDYYSPLEEFAQYNAYELVFGEEFSNIYNNVRFVTDEPFIDEDGALFLPWYWTENPEHFDDMLYRYKMGQEVKCIFCHTDLTVWPGPRIASLKGIPVYSGHIHYPMMDMLSNLYNIGAALPLTFNDVNDYRHIYILENFTISNKIKNITTPLFKRYFNDRIFDLTEEDFNNSYVQLYISNSNASTAKYRDRISEIKTTYTGAMVGVKIVDDDIVNDNNITGVGFTTNINNYIENNIPEHLNNKYNMIKSKLNGELYKIENEDTEDEEN